MTVVMATFIWSATANAVCYVDSAATGTKDGSSWSNAYTSLQSALHDRTAKEIWVRRGVYKPTTTTDQTISFAVALGTQLYGGFAGGESNRDARDPVANPTILSGDIDSNDANTASTNVDTALADIRGDNSYHVITVSGASTGMIDGQTIIDGFTVTGGYAKYSGFHANGGGLNCDGHGNGSGTDAVNCSPTLRNLVFSGNAAIGDGGAVYDNGLTLGSSSPTFDNVSFLGNFARGNGGALCNVADDGGSSSPILSKVYFFANTAALGGAVYDRGEGAAGTAPSHSDPLLTDAMFEGNSADSGGAFYNYAFAGGTASPVIHSATFADNKTNSTSPSPYGGALLVISEGENSSAQPHIVNSTFTSNLATFGGAILDGTISNGELEIYLTNTTISGNGAQIGGGLYNGGDGGRDRVVLNNVILWGDTATSDPSTAEIKNDQMLLGITSSVVQTGCPTDSDSACSNLITASPNLGLLQANGGFTRTIMPGMGSSAIDAGQDSLCPSADQRGVARPQGKHCDIGSVETTPTPPPTADSFTVVTHLNTPVSAALKPGDTNPGGPFTFSFSLVRIPGDGAVSLAGDTATYTPNAGFVGVDSFTYTVSDVNGVSAEAVVTIQVRAADLPVAQPLSLSVPINASGSVTLAASDDNTGGPFAYTFAISQLSQHGSVVLSGASITYTPTAGYVGADSFAYTASDVNGTSLPATVSIQVKAVLPVAQPLSLTVPINASGSVTLIASDDNAGGPFAYTFAIAQPPQHGSFTLSGASVTYTPTAGYVGADSFAYTASDTNGTSLPAIVSIQVNSVIPVAQPRFVTVPHNTATAVAFAATDSNAGGPFTFTFAIASPPAHGTLSLVEGSQVTYTPAHDYIGPDTFTYSATDTNGTSLPTTVTLTVLPGSGGSGPPPANVASTPALSTWNMIGLAGLLGGLAVRRIAR